MRFARASRRGTTNGSVSGGDDADGWRGGKGVLTYFSLFSTRLSDLKNEFVSRDKHGNEVLHCVSISKHCCKVGRKTIPPWFALVYSGYTPASSPDRMDNWTRSQALRLRLQEKGGRNSNPIRAIKPCRGDELPLEEWMSPSAWNVEGWTEACSKRKTEMRQYY